MGRFPILDVLNDPCRMTHASPASSLWAEAVPVPDVHPLPPSRTVVMEKLAGVTSWVNFRESTKEILF